MNDTSLPLIFLVGGDAATHAMLRFLLEGDGYAVVESAGVGAAPSLPRGAEAALTVVVAGEREGEALATLGEARRVWPRTPMLLLSRDVGLALRRGAFALGVQDVVALPIGPHDLRTRLRTALSGSTPRGAAARAGGEFVRAGGLLLNKTTREVSNGNGWSVRLTRRESALLGVLMAAPGRVAGREALVEQIWGGDDGDDRGSANALAVYVRRLRGKLTHGAPAQGYVRTVHGQGYVFDARSAPRLDVERAGDRREILVVDDDRATLDMMAEALRVAGYTVTCGVGAQAPTLARQTLPAVILLDINMPGMNGVEVRQRLRESPRTATIPVIALSAGGNLRLRARDMGADDYLAKPFSTDELLLRVEKWVGRAP